MATDKLKEYKRKRDFNQTNEPAEGGRGGKRPKFVIQQHDARAMHYDFRLEVDGVLKSWAVPKGPSMDPKDKRLAVETEDHPMSYADFEGVIPEGNYGAGNVIVWDMGYYVNIKSIDGEPVSMEESYNMGTIEIWLEGKKLQGGFALIRMKDKKSWLLIKMRDAKADARRNPVSTQPESVISGKKVTEIKR